MSTKAHMCPRECTPQHMRELSPSLVFECRFQRRKSRTTNPGTRRHPHRPPLPSAAAVRVRRRGPAVPSGAIPWLVWLSGTLLLPWASAQYSDLRVHPRFQPGSYWLPGAQ